MSKMSRRVKALTAEFDALATSPGAYRPPASSDAEEATRTTGLSDPEYRRNRIADIAAQYGLTPGDMLVIGAATMKETDLYESFRFAVEMIGEHYKVGALQTVGGVPMGYGISSEQVKDGIGLIGELLRAEAFEEYQSERSGPAPTAEASSAPVQSVASSAPATPRFIVCRHCGANLVQGAPACWRCNRSDYK